MISKTHTLDGVEVITGLRVWDYDLRARVVGEVSLMEGTDPWYKMHHPVTNQRGSDMNPSRMWFRHPTTGKKA